MEVPDQQIIGTNVKKAEANRLALTCVSEEARARGYNVELIHDGRRRRLKINSKLAQVKGQTKGTWQVGDIGQLLQDNTDFIILVAFGRGPHGFYIAPGDQIREQARSLHDEFLRKHGGTRPHTAESGHHAIEVSHVAQWHQRWDLLAAYRRS